MQNSVSIPISDDDSDDLAEKKRARARRKRKKHGHRGSTKNEILRRSLRLLRRWWPLVLFLPAIGLLLFESSKLAHRAAVSDPEPDKDKGPAKDLPPVNLDSLVPVTRVIGGVRQPCFKILPSDELRNLEFPQREDVNSHVRRVVYKSDPGNYVIAENATQHTGYPRFNLFTGNQTLREREESFKVNETAEVHCGFYSEIGGFKISDEDKSYMNTCRAVVSTCAFGGGDDLYQPIGMTEASLTKVCYVAFWDDITQSSQEEAGVRIDANHMIGKWRIVVVKDLPFMDQRLNGKIPKLLSHRLFPQAKYSIWVDSKSQFRRDPLGVLEALLWRSNSVLAISEHGARSSLYDEAKAVVHKNKATPEEVEIQLNQYRQDGVPDVKRFKGKKALAEASIIVREHTPLTNIFMCLWFNEVVRFTSRDQLSFPYVLMKLKIRGIHMFPVCIRKDLVNSMGHRRKVKPLVRTGS